MTQSVVVVLSSAIGFSAGTILAGTYDILRFFAGGKFPWRQWLVVLVVTFIVGFALGALITLTSKTEFSVSLLPYWVATLGGWIVEEIVARLAKRGILRRSRRETPF
jgi:hypothetical protein